LTEDARAGLPLLGKWAAMELRPGDRAEFFERVGLAFADARGRLKPEAVVDRPEVKAALEDMADRAHESKRLAREEIRKEVVAELTARGVTTEYTITLACYDREDRDLLLVLYLLFESGDAGLHRAASPEFYRGVAALFGVDAARLSRGEVVKLVTPEGVA
jgi:hypothetical protein